MKQPRTSLDVGFTELPERFAALRGRASRSIPMQDEFPFEDAQFEVVILEAKAVSYAAVKEAHRVLRPEGCLYFVVPERNSKQAGFLLPDIYAIVREGFNIIKVERSAWWHFKRIGREISICARKKNWKTYKGLFRKGSVVVSPFQNARKRAEVR